MLDGIILNDTSTPERFTGTIELSDIDRIEVLKGPQSTLWGSDAIGGGSTSYRSNPNLGLAAASAVGLAASAPSNIEDQLTPGTRWVTSGLTSTIRVPTASRKLTKTTALLKMMPTMDRLYRQLLEATCQVIRDSSLAIVKRIQIQKFDSFGIATGVRMATNSKSKKHNADQTHCSGLKWKIHQQLSLEPRKPSEIISQMALPVLAQKATAKCSNIKAP